MKVRIEIDTRTFVRFWLVMIGFALAALFIISAQQALVIIGMAFFLALALNRPVNALAKLFPGRSRVGGTALAPGGTYVATATPTMQTLRASVMPTQIGTVDWRLVNNTDALQGIERNPATVTGQVSVVQATTSGAASCADGILGTSLGSLPISLTIATLSLLFAYF